MFTLPRRRDGFRLLLPDEFILPEINEKYTPILQKTRGYIVKPIDFINETIQKVQVFGFNNAAFEQQQPTSGRPIRVKWREEENAMLTGGSTFQYRNPISVAISVAIHLAMLCH